MNDGYIGSISIDIPKENDEATIQCQVFPHTVVIVDRSGSMGNYVAKMVNDVLPIMFKKLSYDPKTLIHLITFDSQVEYLNIQVEDLKDQEMQCRGQTYMAGAVLELQLKLFGSFDPSLPVRVLTVSDGAIHDQYQVTIAGDNVAKMVSESTFRINSQAVRLFTSYMQPDTTALCSLLQLNNTTLCKLLDIEANIMAEDMASQIAELFINDGFGNGLFLTSESSIFLSYPWEVTPLNKMILTIGNNVFWMKEIPTTDIKVNDISVVVSIEPELTLEAFYELLSVKFDYIIGHLKVLKIVGSQEAIETSKQILEYFTEQENILKSAECLVDGTLLSNRVKKTIMLKRKKLSLILAAIINDDTVSKLNSAQKADYLRQIDITKTSRGLAKRANKKGLDFVGIARNEVMAIAKNINEIKDIDDSDHLVSFFSQDTTLGGIKALVEVSQSESFDAFDVDDIMELLNLVGVACSGPIGDFPNPMQWRADEIFLGCYVSLSDILTAYKQSKGSNLKVPASDKEMTNVIPVFDDPKIGKFMRKYAPSLLEYTFSIGMRRVIAVVPMTIGYTMSAGLWKMIPETHKNKSSLHLSVFQKLITTFDSFVGKYFDHITPFLKDQQNGNLSFCIGYNGINNMMSPLIRLFKNNARKDASQTYKVNDRKLEIVPNILRTLYSFEVWQTIRIAYKGKPDSEDIIKEMLYKLLGIDINRQKTPLEPLFDPEPEISDIQFYDEPVINETYLAELTKPIHYINYLSLIPKYFDAAINDRLESIKDVPKMSNVTVLKSLQIDYPYNLFLFFNVFQALRYSTRASREDLTSKKMKIVDLKNHQEAANDVKNYIRELFKSQYKSELSVKRKKEGEAMGEILAKKIFQAKDYKVVTGTWKNGITCNGTLYKIENPLSPGYKVLCKLLCGGEKTAQWSSIFKILLFGVDKDKKPVWNHGGVNYLTKAEKAAFKKAFLDFYSWKNWDLLMTDYRLNYKKFYRRDPANRHTHGISKRSYWANGYASMDEFCDAVSEDDFRAYCKIHFNCCGVRDMGESFLQSLNINPKNINPKKK